ncbi:MAG: formate dehydrogenase, partial [Deltaproteobacteria bacterium RBG_13_52_11]
MADKTFFIDTTRCTACRGCQIACKEWNQNPATKTKNWGSHQNPEDLSFVTYKLVRFSEVVSGGELRWYFFPDQCRHCVEPPCKDIAESLGYKKAITKDAATGAVLFNQKVKIKPKDFGEIKDACPYNIPRYDAKQMVIAKCTMCIDRVSNGLLPACVKSCPTGTMNFGDRSQMLALANERLKVLKAEYPKARLLNAEDVRTVFLVIDDAEKYHKFAKARGPLGITRLVAMKKL